MSSNSEMVNLLQEINLNIAALMNSLTKLSNTINRSAEADNVDTPMPNLIKEILDVISAKTIWKNEDLVVMIREASLISLNNQRLRRR